MMNKFFFLVLIALPVSLFSQFTSLRLETGAAFKSGKLFFSKQDKGTIGPGSDIEESLQSAFGFTTTALTGWELSPRASLFAGFCYERSPYIYKAENIRLPEDLPLGTTTTIEEKITLQRIGIPLRLRYELGQSRRLAGIIGFSLERVFFEKEAPVITGAGANDPAMENFSQVAFRDFSFFASAGLDILLWGKENNQLLVHPLFSVGLQPEDVFRTEPRSIYIYRAAVTLAFVHKLGKL